MAGQLAWKFGQYKAINALASHAKAASNGPIAQLRSQDGSKRPAASKPVPRAETYDSAHHQFFDRDSEGRVVGRNWRPDGRVAPPRPLSFDFQVQKVNRLVQTEEHADLPLPSARCERFTQTRSQPCWSNLRPTAAAARSAERLRTLEQHQWARAEHEIERQRLTLERLCADLKDLKDVLCPDEPHAEADEPSLLSIAPHGKSAPAGLGPLIIARNAVIGAWHTGVHEH